MPPKAKVMKMPSVEDVKKMKKFSMLIIGDQKVEVRHRTLRLGQR